MKKNQWSIKLIIKSALVGFVFLSPLFIPIVMENVCAEDGSELSATDLEHIKIATAAPDFYLESVEGTRVKLSSFQNKKSVILIFYRGYW